MSAPVAVYVHIPFCPSKCGYCDFNSFAMDGEIVPRTMAAIAAEIRRSPWAGRPAKTIFFGGGTPTFPLAEQLVEVLEAVLETHPPLEGCEVTSEANPGTVDAAKFAAMRAAGFNRVSLGAQSFRDDDLLRLDRVHRASEIGRAVRAAREAGFEDLNLDLMFALPGQTPRGWTDNLDRALELEPDHLSLYCLTIEPNTAFYKKERRGEIVLPDEDAQVGMYDETLRRVAAAGFHQYEISNFCRPGRECRHNLEYWRGREYVGYGPGAVGAAEVPDGSGRARTTNLKSPRLYSDAVEAGLSSWMEVEPLTAEELALERLLLGLRLNDGIPGEPVDPKGLARARAAGWVAPDAPVRLTDPGRHLHGEVAALLAL